MYSSFNKTLIKTFLLIETFFKQSLFIQLSDDV